MSERPSMLDVLANMVEALSERSTCSRAHNGALIYDSRGVILSGGYNGALSGLPHCEHPCDCGDASGVLHVSYCRYIKPCDSAMHAEANAIVWAARRGVATEGHSIITTMSPCYRCAQLIIQAGIIRVVALRPYRDQAGVKLLVEAGIIVTQEVPV